MTSANRPRALFALIALVVAVVAGGSHYTVRPGDTLSEIAVRHGTTVAALAEANHLADPDLIVVGQQLAIPDGAGGGSAHVVERGETLSSIARRYGVSAQQIAEANGLVDPNLIFAGTRLLLAPQGPAPQPVPERRIHVVRRGETLSGIAARYGTTVGAIAEANGISDPNLVRAGAALSVPVGGFRCPVPGAEFFNDWGFARSDGRFHTGNDLFAPRGTPVLAPVSGVVEHYTGDIGGLQFRLTAADGTTYIGTHLDSFGKEGSVAAGEVIGYVGDSGTARGSRPHLHFEIIPSGDEEVNPYPVLIAACG